ncbi:CBO0543 family protein [Neobacillus vireti]|uniref:CBO0543 family protein n=1 Tax=Neobacillus vireti TaxID=220686 RepID=UPI002FFFE0B7
MLKEQIIELSSCIIALVLLFFCVPKSKIREATLSLFFMQSLTWILSGIIVELKLIAYPVRFFSYAFRTSFTFEYIIFPVISVVFNLYYPRKGTLLNKISYTIAYPTVLIIGEVIVEKFTDNIEYLHWNWFFSWISMLVTLNIVYSFYKWFFRKYRIIKYTI